MPSPARPFSPLAPPRVRPFAPLGRAWPLALALALGAGCSDGAAAMADTTSASAGSGDTGGAQSDAPDDNDTDTAEPFDHGEAPNGLGVHGYAHACVALEAFDGDRTLRFLRAEEAGLLWTADAADTAAPLRLQPAALGVYLLYDDQRRFVFGQKEAGASTTALTLTAPTELDSEVDELDPAFRSPAEWILKVSSRNGSRYQLRHGATGRYLRLDGLTDDVSAAAIGSLHPAQGCADFPEMALGAEGSVEPRA